MSLGVVMFLLYFGLLNVNGYLDFWVYEFCCCCCPLKLADS